jgi:hypothetical protein
MGLLLLDSERGKHLDDQPRGDLQLTSQLVDPDSTHMGGEHFVLPYRRLLFLSR